MLHRMALMMGELSWLSLLGIVALALLAVGALVVCCYPRTLRDIRLSIKAKLALRSKMYNQLGLHFSNGSLPAFGKAHAIMDGVFDFPLLNTAVELGLFELLQDSRDTPMSVQAIAERVKARNTYAMGQLLQYLVSKGILFVKVGQNGERLYWHMMTKEAIDDIRLHAQMFQLVQYRQLWHTTDSIRTGSAVGLDTVFPGAKSLYHAREIFPEVQKLWTPWMEDTTNVQMGPAIESLDLSPFTHLLDWCGSTGYNSIKLCKKFPKLSATVLDLPKVCAEVPETVAAAGLDVARVKTISRDLTNEFELPVGTFDCVLMSNCVIEWAEKDLLRFFAAIKKALKPGGKVFVLSGMAGEHNDRLTDQGLASFSPYFFCCADASSIVHEKSALVRLLGIAGFSSIDFRIVSGAFNACMTVVEAS